MNPNDLISNLTSQLTKNGIAQDQINSVIGGLNLQKTGVDMITSQLPNLLSQNNIPTDVITKVIANITQDGFQIEDITSAIDPSKIGEDMLGGIMGNFGGIGDMLGGMFGKK